MDGLEATLNVDAEFRHEGHDSALNPSATIWHAWRSLKELQGTLSLERPLRRAKHKTASDLGRQARAKNLKRDPNGEIFKYRCMDEGCAKRSDIVSSATGIFDHMYVQDGIPLQARLLTSSFSRNRHKVIVPDDRQAAMLEGTFEERKAKYEAFVG